MVTNFLCNSTYKCDIICLGLPSDVTETEFGELMSKCGIIMEDPDTGNFVRSCYFV